MEKYYLTKMEELEPSATSRLLEVQFLRRPPTFGLLFARTSQNNKCQFKLANLSLNNENKAKFATLREISLEGVGKVVALDTFNWGQILVECSQSSGSRAKAFEQLMSSSVFALTQSGQLLAISMLKRNDENNLVSPPCDLLKECKPSNPQAAAPGKFLQLYVQAACTSQDASSLGSQDNTHHRTFHVLSQRCYFAYLMKLKESPPGGAAASPGDQLGSLLDWCELELVQEYTISLTSTISSTRGNLLQPVELTRMLPVDSSRGSALLESSDGSLRVIRRGTCVWTFQAPGGGGARQSLLLLQSREASAASVGARGEPDNILLSLTSKNQLVAHSLSISAKDQPSIRSQDKEQKGKDIELDMMLDGGGTEPARAKDRDPDGLLPQEPSFELDECWSIELGDLLDSISGLGSAPDSGDEDDSSGGGRGGEQTGGSYLCLPLWLPQGPTAAAGGEDESTRRWPQFLLIFHKHHVLVYSFEQENPLPFSVVYDRAFMNLTSGEAGESSGEQVEQAAHDVKRVDLRARPRLLHNIKLVGTQPSDCLFNLIFLSTTRGASKQRRPAAAARISQARHFNQLGLMAATTNQGHVLVFKLTSPHVIDPLRKCNLYQQVLLDSLRDDSLLRDELARLKEINSQLRDDTSKLTFLLESVGGGGDVKGHAETESAILTGGGALGHLFESSASGSREIQVRLDHHPLIGNLYELVVEWPAMVFCLFKVIMFSMIEGTVMMPPSPGGGGGGSSSLIENIQITNGNRGENELFSLHDGANKPLSKAKAVLELKKQSDDENPTTATSLSLSSCDDNMKRVQVPLFLQDGLTEAGHVKVYVIFYEKTRSLQAREGTDANNHQLLSSKFNHLQHELEASFMDSAHVKRSGKDQLNFILHELPVRPLMSYRLLAHDDNDEDDHTTGQQQVETLEVSGPFGGEQLLVWLDEILDTRLRDENLDSKSRMRFKSNLTGCSIGVKIDQILKSDGQSSSNIRMLVTSRDPDALDLIKRHTLKRATDNSIRLNIQQSEAGRKQLALAVEEQRRKNSELMEIVKQRAAGSSASQTKHSNDRTETTQVTPAEKEILLESLLGELDQLDLDGTEHNPFGLAAGELMKSTNFLDRSLRRDIEQLFGQ